MKRSIIYILLTTIFFLSASAQNQNDTWIYGNNKVFFNNNTVTFSTINQYFKYGTAIISNNDTGELLFYTDGINIYDKYGQIMQNGSNLLGTAIPNSSLERFYITSNLCGGNKTPQGVIIVPKPGSEYRYYVLTSVFTDFRDCSDGYPTEFFNFGIKYAEIDISANNGLGIVLSKNNVLQNNGSETLTSVINNDNNFWIISTHNGNFNSYLVDENGINSNAVISNFQESVYGPSKVSPDGKFIFNKANYFLFNFNNNNGIVSSPIEILPSENHDYYLDFLNAPSNIEFSPNSKIIYFISTQPFLNRSAWLSGISMYNIETQEIAGVNNNTIYDFPLNYDSANLQLTPFGRIFLIFNNQTVNSGGMTNVSFGNYVSGNYYSYEFGEISNPNTWNPNANPINYYQMPINNKNGCMFPQLIPFFEGCIENLTITEEILSDQNITFEVNNAIFATNIINEGAIVNYQAGKEITLGIGFNAKSGSDFVGYISDCSSKNQDFKGKRSFTFNKYNDEEEKIKLYPVPIKSEELKIESDLKIIELSITNKFGLVFIQKTKLNLNNLEISFNNFKKGIYFISFKFANGSKMTKKVLKL